MTVWGDDYWLGSNWKDVWRGQERESSKSAARQAFLDNQARLAPFGLVQHEGPRFEPILFSRFSLFCFQ